MSADVSTTEDFDAIIIGSGQGGNPLAEVLTAAGKKTAMIERKDAGGTCINTGCTPTKTMVASARVAYLARRGGDYGVDVGPVAIDMARVRERKRNIVLTLAPQPRKKAGQRPCGTHSRRSLLYRSGENKRRPPRRRKAAAGCSPDLHQHRHPERPAGD